MALTAFFSGFALGLSLILAIGAQNAFVLKQGIKRQYVFTVCSICALSDALLISLGVFGFGEIIQQYPLIVEIARYFGAFFLFVYGLKSFHSAIKQHNSLQAQGQEQQQLVKIVLVCLAFTWLNPHVYLDTVILIGAISTQFSEKYSFALGAMFASFVFFFSLGYGAKLLRPLFANPKSWKILDILIGIIMWSIACSLLWNN
ncbi:LysE/ArgO family amino acid transporter [Volucribacter amazonae]|uniref:Amino acid transporter n=1 Tax=Volucribacter amazonae TaxID=256731 RepID=A0A9X4SPT1_9PAST|nr:LysE/ArgO family amino acid transporter [Volucribacter amazonae]MDG6894461.1 amino acid transporter [Volucribacter amazonae]